MTWDAADTQIQKKPGQTGGGGCMGPGGQFLSKKTMLYDNTLEKKRE